MRIALVRRNFAADDGGSRILATLGGALAEAGYAVHIFAERWQENPDSRLTWHRVPVVRTGSALRTLTFAFAVRALLRDRSFDIVHSFERTIGQDIYRAGDGCHSEWLRRRRLAAPGPRRWLDPVNPLHRVLLFLERRIYGPGGTAHVVANSRQGCGEIQAHYGTAPERLQVIYNGVDLARFHPAVCARLRAGERRALGLNEEAVAILFLGNGFERKGLRALLAAAALLLRDRVMPPFRVLVVGRDRREPYARLAATLGLRERVTFLGGLASPETAYAAADLFALPTLYDPFANVCLEAMACGLPVVTTRANGASEVIDPGKQGWVLEDPADSRGLAEACGDLFSAGRRQEMGRLARKRAEEFSVGRHVGETLGLYERVLRGRRPTAPLAVEKEG